jgi:hypothetical protein
MGFFKVKVEWCSKLEMETSEAGIDCGEYTSYCEGCKYLTNKIIEDWVQGNPFENDRLKTGKTNLLVKVRAVNTNECRPNFRAVNTNECRPNF